jgi:hypothetical protein
MTLELPELTFEIATRLSAFREHTIRFSARDVKRYIEATGDRNPAYEQWVPPAMAAVFGRQAYLVDHRMPGGGVLLAEQIQWFRPAVLDSDLTVRAVVENAHVDAQGRRKISFLTTALQSGRKVCEVRIEAGWPR